MAEDSRVQPLVGAVAVKDGEVLASAFRGEVETGEHAEYVLLERKLADVDLAGATVYTTLQPCSRRNPPKLPCADRLVERRVSRVAIGMLDPNPVIQGNGFLRLREAPIAVQTFPDQLMGQIENMDRRFIREMKSSRLVGEPRAHTPAHRTARWAQRQCPPSLPI